MCVLNIDTDKGHVLIWDVVTLTCRLPGGLTSVLFADIVTFYNVYLPGNMSYWALGQTSRSDPFSSSLSGDLLQLK